MQQKIGTSHSVSFERLCTGRVRGLSACKGKRGKDGFGDEKVIKRKAS